MAVVSPLVVDDVIVGTLQAYAPRSTAGLARAADEVAPQRCIRPARAGRARRLAEQVDGGRGPRAAGPDQPALRLQLPRRDHKLRRTDPDRARELLLEFADFTRYSFRRHGDYTTLAEELRSIERYLLLEQARFGDRLRVTLRVAPEVLPVTVPFLCVQPLVENAVQHGLGADDGVGHITITAHDRGQDCVIEVEDDGAARTPSGSVAPWPGTPAWTPWGSATSTPGSGPPSETSTVSSSRPPRVPARRSSSGFRSSPPGCRHDRRGGSGRRPDRPA